MKINTTYDSTVIVTALRSLGYNNFGVDETKTIVWYNEPEVMPTEEEIISQCTLSDRSLVYTKIRDLRNYKLSKCDWTVMPDSPLSAEKIEEWKVYRQALRDITTNSYNLFSEVIWPSEPS